MHRRDKFSSAKKAPVADVAPVPKKSRKVAALEEALASAFDRSEERRPSSKGTGGECDAYGKGSATDRLQFGYSPSITEEAVAYHSRISASEWVAQRKQLGHITLRKKQKLTKLNCEPLASVLKLKSHWQAVSQFNVDMRGEHVSAQEADNLLEMLASRQRVES